MKPQKWEFLPILDALRPEPGWKTDHAVFGSYSADPVALLAILLSLAGRDNERGSGSAVDFAETIEALREKVVFLIQCGRLSIPYRSQSVLKVLDSFVTEMHCDEAVESWHPKVALVRQSKVTEETKSPEICWRFWMGSRNFTRDQSWDAGFLLVGTVEEKGKSVSGLIETAQALWARAELPRSDVRNWANELKRVRWGHPPGCKVEEIRFLAPETPGRGLPDAPRRIDDLLVVSPFLDGNTIKELGNWPCVENRRILLSTYRALSAIAVQKGDPLQFFRKGQILYMDDYDESEILADPGVEEASEESADDSHVGLHAKLILARHRGQNTLWLGSPNATKRAWEKNYEIAARLSLKDELAKELMEFVKGGTEFKESGIKFEPISKDEKEIEDAYRQVAARWNVKQRDWQLYATTPPHPDDSRIKLEVGILGGDLVLWPRGITVLKLRQCNPPIETELIQIKISRGKFERRWLQKAPLDPPPGLDRDRRALATLFTPSAFLKWLRSLLDDQLPSGDGQWDDEPDRKKPCGNATRGLPDNGLPTLENILKAWSRNPEALKVVDSRLNAYMEFIRTNAPAEKKEMAHLKEFETVWKTLRAELLNQE